MTEPTPLTPAEQERIEAFAAAVRAHLDDLSPEDIDDLAGGLVGDLTDQAADASGTATLGDPAAYAEELRSSAGLPPRIAAAKRKRTPLHVQLASWRANTAESMRKNAFGRWLLSLFTVVRPFWWVARGWGFWLFIRVLGDRWTYTPTQSLWPQGVLLWVLLIGCVILSIQWGRGKWMPGGWLRYLRTLMSLVALTALVTVAIVVLPHARVVPADAESQPRFPDGLRYAGEEINNIFAFDAEGNPIQRVQLFDGNGQPLNFLGPTVDQFWDGTPKGKYGWTPYTSPLDGLAQWNVFPLRGGDSSRGVDSAGIPLAPFDRVPAVGDDLEPYSPPHRPAPNRSPQPAPSGTPSPAETPVPEGSETPTPEEGSDRVSP